MRLGMLSLVAALAAGSVACNETAPGDDMAVSPDLSMSDGPDLSFAPRSPTDHPPHFTIQSQGGVVLAAPETYTVVWAGDEALGARVDRFFGWLLGSDYWTTSVQEYGVSTGAGRNRGVIVLPAPSGAIGDQEIRAHVRALVANGDVVLNPGTMVMFVIPANVAYIGGGCNRFIGYHQEVFVTDGDAGRAVPFAIHQQCGGFGTGPSWEALTEVLSHEAVEVATDPYPTSDRAWYNQDFEDTFGGEVSDVCANLAVSYSVPPPLDDVYFVTRNYSTQTAMLGDVDPCLPAPAFPYFNAALDPWQPEVTLNAIFGSTTSLLVKPFAYGDVGKIRWRLRIIGNGITAEPSSGENLAGDTVYVKLTLDKTALRGRTRMLVEVAAEKGGKNQFIGILNIK